MIQLALTLLLQTTAKSLVNTVLAKNPQGPGAAQGSLAQLVAQPISEKRAESSWTLRKEHLGT